MVYCFNPRAHAGRDTISTPPTLLKTRFNPRAHAGRDNLSGTNTSGSIGFNPRAHAGRDVTDNPNNYTIPVSIHAPTQGATYIPHMTLQAETRFNPRAHAGRDISRVFAFLPLQSFNPRAHAGRDLLIFAISE